jgi:amino acid permease
VSLFFATWQLLIPSGNPILLLLWIIVAFGGGWAYFFWLPSLFSEKPHDKPAWLQDVGNFSVS